MATLNITKAKKSGGLSGLSGLSNFPVGVKPIPAPITKISSSMPGLSTPTGLVGSNGQPITPPKMVAGTPTNINQALKSDGLSGATTTNNATSTPFQSPAINSLTRQSTFSNQSVNSAPLGSSQKSTPSTNVINAPTLGATNTKLTFPEPTTTKTPTIPPVATTDQQISDAEKKSKEDFQSYLDNLTAPPDSADAYKKAQKQTQILEKQNKVNDLTGQLNSIVATGEKNKLSLVGQGRGIPEVIIGGQQAEIGRETAIQALPVQAQLSAVQGDLDTAEQNLNTLFKIYSDDATNNYNYKKSVNEAVYKFADSQDKAKLERLQKQQDREYEQSQRDLKARQDIALEATKNGAGAATISAITQAPDFNSALKAAGSYMTDTQTVKLDNGNTVVINSQGKVIKNLGGSKSETTGTNFIVTNDTLKNTYGNDVVSLIASTIKNTGAKQSQSTNDAINVIAGLQGFVRDNPNGVFEGLNPFIRTPDKFASDKARTNRSDVEAINLKVQQWASGAALTEEQTKQVKKITPNNSDTDEQIKSKVNALANYMVSQVSGQLAGQGVGFAVDKVDLFTKTPVQELQELYKDPVAKQKIQQATQMFPTYTDAEILQIVKP